MGWFSKKPRAIDILSRGKKKQEPTNEKTKKKVCCCICGKELADEYIDGPEYDDGTDDIYDCCFNCSGKFERWLREKHIREEEES